jgi:hypothetical protein
MRIREWALLTVLGDREMRLKTPPACSRREAAIQIFAQRHLSIGVGMIDSELVLPDWRHAEQVAEDEASLPLFRRLAALLDSDPSSIGDGDAVPLPWTAILFPTLARQGEIGADGHAKHGSFLPVMPLPKRMFAGRTVEQFRPVRIGDRVRRLSTIADVVQKTGRSGPLIFVTILHKITGEEGPYYSERQEVVFREDRPDTPRTATPEAMPSPRWQSRFSPDPVMLFGADLQRASHSLRRALCDRRGRLPRTGRERRPHRADAAAICWRVARGLTLPISCSRDAPAFCGDRDSSQRDRDR